MKVKIITDSKELEEFTSREDISINKIDIRPCDQNFFAQEWFVAVVMYEEKVSTNSIDWQSFRAEAAKDILCAMMNHFGTKYIDMEDVVKWTDSLISKLKEKEEK